MRECDVRFVVCVALQLCYKMEAYGNAVAVNWFLFCMAGDDVCTCNQTLMTLDIWMLPCDLDNQTLGVRHQGVQNDKVLHRLLSSTLGDMGAGIDVYERYSAIFLF